MVRRLGVCLLIVLWAFPLSAKEMNFALQQRDLRPAFDLSQWIFADGDITTGTTVRFLAFVKAHPELIAGAKVIFNSRGGSPLEGMRLGDEIRKLHYRSDVATKGSEPMTLAPGMCLSACIYPYLGGEYRYLYRGSVIGIHRFRFKKDFGGEVTSELSQMMSGQIVDFIKRSRADADLFALMTQTPPENIHVISDNELKKLKIVTGDVYSEEWNFEVRGRLSYLKADQVTVRGENKLLFNCDYEKRMPVMLALSELPDRETIIRETEKITIILDGVGYPVSPAEIVDGPRLAQGSYVSWAIALTPEFVAAIEKARRVGSGLNVSSNVFAGIRGIKIGSGREKLIRTLNDCRLAAANSSPSVNSNRTNKAISSADAMLATRVARNFDNRYNKTGMAGIRGSVEACYAIAKRKLKMQTIEYCYLLDQLASGIDAEFMKQLNHPQDQFWLPEAALKRTLAVLRLVEPDAGESMHTIKVWKALLPIAFSEIAARH